MLYGTALSNSFAILVGRFLEEETTHMSKQFWAVIAAIVIIFVGVFALTGDKKNENNGGGNTNAASNHVLGKSTTGVKLVQFGDFQCSACLGYFPTIKKVVESYGDQISFQYVNFPLTSIHQNAFASARAAEAAGKQGKFWEMHDLLYQNNDPSARTGWVASSSPTTFFNQFATQLSLNLDQFKKDYASQAINSIVNADLAKGNKLDVQGTPAFFIDGKAVNIKNTEDDFKKVLDAEIKKKTTGSGSGAESSGSTTQSTGDAQAQ